jgi:hypothetical protein
MKTQSPTIPTAESLLATVELTADTDGWLAGTTGTLVETFRYEGFVEVVDQGGRSLDIVTVPYSALRLRELNG